MVRQLYNKLNTLPFYSFLASILLLRIPNYYYLPIENTFFTTQVLARIIIGIVFCLNVYVFFLKGKEITNKKETRIIILTVILFFAIQSISILAAFNTTAYMFRYFKDILPGVITFFCFYFYREEYKKIALAVVIPIFLNLFYQILAFANQDLFVFIASKIVYERHFDFIVYDLGRDRLHIDTYDEAAIPLLLLTNITRVRILGYILVFLLAFFSFISNFRTRVLMLIFSILAPIFDLKRVWKTLLVMLFLILAAGQIADTLSLHSFGFSFVDRLTFESENQDIKTVETRIDQVNKAIEIGSKSILGVGLGNFYDTLSPLQSMLFESRDVSEGAQGYVHNVFGAVLAESGFVSLIVFIFMIALFIKMDIKILRGNNEYKKAFMFSFWTIFIYALLNPDVGGAYQVFFWGMRGILLK